MARVPPLVHLGYGKYRPRRPRRRPRAPGGHRARRRTPDAGPRRGPRAPDRRLALGGRDRAGAGDRPRPGAAALGRARRWPGRSSCSEPAGCAAARDQPRAEPPDRDGRASATAFTSAGYADARTYVQSGNIVLSSDARARRARGRAARAAGRIGSGSPSRSSCAPTSSCRASWRPIRWPRSPTTRSGPRRHVPLRRA